MEPYLGEFQKRNATLSPRHVGATGCGFSQRESVSSPSFCPASASSRPPARATRARGRLSRRPAPLNWTSGGRGRTPRRRRSETFTDLAAHRFRTSSSLTETMPVITHTDGNVTQLEGCKMVREPKRRRRARVAVARRFVDESRRSNLTRARRSRPRSAARRPRSSGSSRPSTGAASASPSCRGTPTGARRRTSASSSRDA